MRKVKNSPPLDIEHAVELSAVNASRNDASVSASAAEETERYLTVVEVAERFSVSCQTIWRWSKAADPAVFPAPVSIRPGTTRWRFSDLIEFERQISGGGK